MKAEEINQLIDSVPYPATEDAEKILRDAGYDLSAVQASGRLIKKLFEARNRVHELEAKLEAANSRIEDLEHLLNQSVIPSEEFMEVESAFK